MVAALRKTPTSTNGGSDVGTTFAQAIDTEIEALWATASVFLISIGGTANAITASSDSGLVGPIVAYARPMAFWLIPTATNTLSVTINIDGVGAVNVYDKDGNALVAGALVASRLHLIIWDGTQFRVWSSSTPAVQATPSPDIILQEQQAQNTSAGTFSASSWVIRALNTSVRNVIAGSSFASNAITLPAGTYCIEWSAPAYSVTQNKTRLFNVTDSSVVAGGSSEYTSSAAQVRSSGKAVFTISVPKAFRIEHFCISGISTNGLGVASNIATEIYSWMEVYKIA